MAAWQTGLVPVHWRSEERQGRAADLHASWPSVEARPEERAVARCRPLDRAVVLGSTQPDDLVLVAAAGAAGVAVARRRSGGGAVLVTPTDPVWIDVWVPAGDPLWEADVSRSFRWLGETWRRALEDVLGPGHGGGLVVVDPGQAGDAARRVPGSDRWADSVCFAGHGWGEVVTGDGRKVVGLAQRRTRAGAWFHGACVLRWSADVLLDVLAHDPVDRRTGGAVLAGVAAGVLNLAGVAAGVLDLAGPEGGPEDAERIAGVRALVESAFLAQLGARA